MPNKYNYEIEEIIISQQHYEPDLKNSYAFIWKKDVYYKDFLPSMVLPNQALSYGIENLVTNTGKKP